MRLKDLTFRNRLVISFIIIAVPLVVVSSGLLYLQIKKIIERGIEKELQQSAESLSRMIHTSAGITIKNRLQGIAEKNFEIAEYYYSKHRSGLLTRQEAIKIIEEIFLNQSIGISGYIYCLNSLGDVIIHPDDKIAGMNISHIEFAKKQIALKDGYIEYDWNVPEKTANRPKAVFMVYYKPLDWIISVSTFRDEFSYLVDIKEFRDVVLSFKSEKSGYAFILDESGKALIHPAFEGKNFLHEVKAKSIVEKLLLHKSGKLRYAWQNPDDAAPRNKLVFFRHLPKYKWIIGASSYIDEIYAPLRVFTIMLIADMAVLIIVFIGLILLVSKSITRPLDNLARAFDAGAQGDFTGRLSPGPDDELGRLAGHFNGFMDQLETYHHQLNREIKKTVDTQAALVDNELKLRGLFNQSFQYTCILSPYGILEEVNKSLLEFAGCTEIDVLYQPYWDMPWLSGATENHEIEPLKAAVEKAKNGKGSRLETIHIDRNGDVRNIDISVKPIFNNASQVEFIITEARDMTELKHGEDERRKLAVQLEKSQKMEAIGTLAGGIAHDFNNILSSVFGYAQLAEMTLDTPEKTRQHLAQIVKGAQRASGLVQQILTFSRQNEFEKRPLKFHLVVKEALKLLRSSIPTTIDIVSQINTRQMVNADPTQMHQVIMNLCTNAFHAMQDTGGTMTVSLETAEAPEPGHWNEYCRFSGEPLMKLVVSDTGHGMDDQTLKKAFDPYFTTKEVGRGTGFGLALVHAIVEEHDGFIHVDSTPGVGSSFYIYLPVVTEKKQDTIRPDRSASPQGGSECIMVVDDEPDIRKFLTELLEKFGYTVQSYPDGQKALAAIAEGAANFDLVVTDMTMPLMTGTALAEQIYVLKKDLPVVLCSGYNETLTGKEKKMPENIKCFIQKPIMSKDFLFNIRKLIDGVKG